MLKNFLMQYGRADQVNEMGLMKFFIFIFYLSCRIGNCVGKIYGGSCIEGIKLPKLA